MAASLMATYCLSITLISLAIARVSHAALVQSSGVLVIRIGEATCNVLDFGAKGDGVTNDTRSVQAAIDDCAKKGGGTVLFPSPHRFLINSVSITGSHIEINVQHGATILLSDDRKKWPASREAAFLNQGTINDIVFTGGGVVDGQGAAWWPDPDAFRPYMILFKNTVQRVLITNITFLNAPNHNLELYANNVEIAHVNIFAPSSHGPQPSHNTDGIDVHGSPFYIHHCNITTGDDNIAVHASHVVVENSFFGSGHGASIGSICTEHLTNITFRGIVFDGRVTGGQDAGVRIKTKPNCSGSVSHVLYDNLTLFSVATTIDITMFYHLDMHILTHSHNHPHPHTRTPPAVSISNINITNILAVRSGKPGHFLCEATTPCHTIRLDNVHHQQTSGSFACSNAHGTATSVSPPSCLKPDVV
eukprot:m.241781 g.241781  ORF g.241781 m.241781 type:complete len:418 (+) comp24779_c0_seq1:249-1502(+)